MQLHQLVSPSHTSLLASQPIISSGTKVTVIGIGGLGHLAIQFAAKMGCEVRAQVCFMRVLVCCVCVCARLRVSRLACVPVCIACLCVC